MHRFFPAVAAAFVVMGGAVVSTVVSTALALDRVAQIESVHSGKCLDVMQASKEPGAPIVQYTCTGSDNQKWTIRDRGNGAHEIVAAHSGMCMDVSGASQDDAAPIIQYPCNGQTNQRFLIDGSDGRVRITSVNSSKCLDIEGGTTDDLAKLIQYACNNQANQQFRLR